MQDELKIEESKTQQFSRLLAELKLEYPTNSGLQRINDPFGRREKLETLRGEWEKDRFNKEAASALLTEIRILLPLAKSKHIDLDFGMLYNLRNMIYKYN